MAKKRIRQLEINLQFSPLPPLLFRQTAIITLLIGILASLWWQAIFILPALLWIDSRAHCRSRMVVCIALSCLGFLWGSRTPEIPKWDGEALKIDVYATVDKVSGLMDKRLQIILRDVEYDGTFLDGKLLWIWDDALFRPVEGQKVRSNFRIRPSTYFRNNGGKGDYWQNKGVYWRTYTKGTKGNPRFEGIGLKSQVIREKWRQKTSEILQNTFNEANLFGWELIPALIFNDRSFFTPNQIDLLARAGLSHSIALSGQHLAVTGFFALIVLWLVSLPNPLIYLRIPRYKLILPVSLLFAIGYLWIGDGPNSLWRAFLMMACWEVYILIKKPAAFPDAMLTALICMVMFNPLCLVDTGVQLSFCSVASICLMASSINRVLMPSAEASDYLGVKGVFYKTFRFTLAITICSLTVQIALFPLTLSIFGYVAPFFLMNIVWIPILGFWVLPCSFAGLIFVIMEFCFLAKIFLIIASLPCICLINILEFLNNLGIMPQFFMPRPHWSGIIGWGFFIVALACFLHSFKVNLAIKKMLVCSAIFLICNAGFYFTWKFHSDVEVRLIDVGQGQAVLIELPKGQRFLIDAGGVNSTRFDTGRDIVAPIISYNAPLRIDFVAMTHPDIDHAGGIPFLMKTCDVDTFFAPSGLSTDASRAYKNAIEIANKKNIKVCEVSFGMKRKCNGGFEIEFLAPIGDKLSHRNDGLIVRISKNGKGLVIIPGDATDSQLNELARQNIDIEAELYIAAHHGSATSVSKEFLRKVKPKEVWVSCGIGNHFNFPSDKIKQWCRKNNIQVKTTSDFGELRKKFEL